MLENATKLSRNFALLIPQYKDYLRQKEMKHSTIRDYPISIKGFLSFLEHEQKVTVLNHIKPDHLRIYHEAIKVKPNYSLAARRNRMTVVKSFLVFLYETGHLSSNLANEVPVPTLNRGRAVVVAKAPEPLRHEFCLLIEQFREYLQAKNLSSRTSEEYPEYIKSFLAYLEDREVEDIRSVVVGHIQGYHNLLRERTYQGRPLSVSTIQMRLSQVKTFFRFLHKTGKIYFDPACNYDLPKRGKRLPRNILEIKEVIKLLEAPDLSTSIGIRDKAIMELLYSSALRNTELRELELKDINLEDQTLYIIGKGDVEALVPYGSAAKRALEHYLLFSRLKLLKHYRGGKPVSEKRLKAEKGKEYLFLSKNAHLITPANLYQMIMRYAKAVDIEHKVGPHSLRHSCATHLLKNGADIRHIQQLLRHKDINTTQIYTHVAIEDLKMAQAKYHPRERTEK